ncbi:MAG: hypothetical protein GF353_02810 [Candidatus Lokiarchaeota archaeon]|nr:hypothetical protein [Candidatus Lokiarchaeota archaeon]
MIKKRDFYHQRIKYSFNWNLKNHKIKLNQLLANYKDFKRLGSYLKKIYEGTVPNDLFNRNDITRVSSFRVKGLKNGFIRSFSKKLIRSGKIECLDSDSKLSSLTQKVFETFKKNSISRKPGHDPVLKNILIKDKDSIAIEIPVWMKLNNLPITGHIDLIQIVNNTIRIIDYKPEGNFLHSLPQVASYGLLIKKLLKPKNLICASFNIKETWIYEPEILLKDIDKYLKEQGVTQNPWNLYF